MRGPRFPRLTSIVLAGSLVAIGSFAGSVPARGTTLCESPPPVVPEQNLTPGTVGTAWTVVKGTKPVSFAVKVLGTLKDGIAPGIDFILIKVSGPVIDKTGGIAAGMSGSPVYVGGVLAGSVSYGFYGADPTIGGMTPAAAMERVLSYPTPPSLSRRSVRIGSGLRAAFARASGSATASSTPTAATPLPVPMNVSGLVSSTERSRLQHWFDRQGSPFVVTTGSSASAPTPSGPMGAPPKPGDAIGAVFSFGDATFGAIGTTTIVCQDQFVAFGHPFTFTGSTSLALTNARILQTLGDPSHVSGGFKLGEITSAAGTITQDRLAGIGGVTGVLPTLTPIDTDLSDPALGTSRQGSTEVASQDVLPYIAYTHMYLNLATVADAEGPGSAQLSVTIHGTDAVGEPWTVLLSDVYASAYDLPNEVGFEALYRPLAELVGQNFEDVTVGGVSVSGTVSDRDASARVMNVLSRTGLQHRFAARPTIAVRPGGQIELRVMLLPAGSHTAVPVDLKLTAPRTLKGGGALVVTGGGGQRSPGGRIRSFDQLVQALNHQPKQSDVVAEIGGRGATRPHIVRTSSGYVVTGRRFLQVVLKRR
jgi:SpoIVB peptidase S55